MRPLLADPTGSDADPSRMPLLEHLRELRWRLMRCTWAFALALLFMVCAPMPEVVEGVTVWKMGLVEPVYHWLTAPFVKALLDNHVAGGLSIVNSPFEGIYTWLRVAMSSAAVITLPVWSYQLWQFIAPGLYQTERRVVVPLAMCSTFLFVAGALFAYYGIFPLAFPFFLQVIDAQASLSIEGYLAAVTRLMLAFGLCFQLPVAVWFLSRMGLVDHKDLIRGFRYALVAIVTIAGILTPPEMLTQVMLAVPLTMLYGVGIVVSYFSSTKVREPIEAT